jgi:hypothetical protein
MLFLLSGIALAYNWLKKTDAISNFEVPNRKALLNVISGEIALTKFVELSTDADYFNLFI